MKQEINHNPNDQQRRNMEYAEDKFMLFDTIRDIVDEELDRRTGKEGKDLSPERQPPKPPPQKRTLWQRLLEKIAQLFL